MKIDFMRKVDMFVGNPMCFVLSTLNRIISPFKKKLKKSPEKILFIQISEMGSAVSVSPSINLLKKNYPKAEIYYLIFDEMSEIVRIMGQIKEKNIFTIRSKSIFFLFIDTLKVIWQLRKKKMDVIIDLELFSRVSSILSFLIGAKEIIGFNKFHMEGLYRGNFHTKKVIYNHTRHISLNFLSCVYAIKEDNSPFLKKNIEVLDYMYPKKIEINKISREKIIKKINSINPEFEKGINSGKKVIIINPNASQLLPLRRWALANYKELAKRIIAKTDAFIVLTGAANEAEDTKTVADAVKNKRCIDFAGKTSLRELIDLYNISDVLVSNDSGPPNFAALTDIKIVVLFGPETPLCYKPLSRNISVMFADLMCSPCVSAYNHRKSACKDNMCMKSISVDSVYQEIIKSI